MRTTSPPGRSKGKPGPIRSVRLSVTVSSADPTLRERLRERGVSVATRGGRVELTFAAGSPDEALEKLKVIGDLLSARKG